jgi:hypothetical protein
MSTDSTGELKDSDIFCKRQQELAQPITHVQLTPIKKRYKYGEHFLNSGRMEEPSCMVSEIAHIPRQLPVNQFHQKIQKIVTSNHTCIQIDVVSETSLR